MLKYYINEINPDAFIKEIASDRYCVVRGFQEGLLLCYDYQIQIKDVVKALRSEILTNHKFYSDFSPADVNILTELDLFLTNPLTYYNVDTVDLFLIAFGNSYTCKTIIYLCDGERTWMTDMRDPNKDCNKTLYFAKTNLSHLDLALNVPGSTQPLPTVETSPHVENIESDSDVEITKIVPGNLVQEDRFVKTGHQSENSDNEINVSEDIPTSNLKKVSANETQARSTHGATLSTNSDHSSDDRCNINHMMLEDETETTREKVIPVKKMLKLHWPEKFTSLINTGAIHQSLKPINYFMILVVNVYTKFPLTQANDLHHLKIEDHGAT